MTESEAQALLLPSLKRALCGASVPILRQASIEAAQGRCLVNIRFQVSADATAEELERLSVVATEVVADFPAPWRVEVEYLVTPALSPLSLIACGPAESAPNPSPTP